MRVSVREPVDRTPNLFTHTHSLPSPHSLPFFLSSIVMLRRVHVSLLATLDVQEREMIAMSRVVDS